MSIAARREALRRKLDLRLSSVKPNRVEPISMVPGIAWIASGSRTAAPTSRCRHTKKNPKNQRLYRQIQCPHCGLWSLWVLR